HGQLSNEPKKRLFLHDYKVHRKPNPDTLDETLPAKAFVLLLITFSFISLKLNHQITITKF
ncbi:MAG: hypothetical protein IJP72_06850, partial [Bacteroidales bacterium]|nr:hypothetical protein [Bacteroidales bacterium]